MSEEKWIVYNKVEHKGSRVSETNHEEKNQHRLQSAPRNGTQDRPFQNRNYDQDFE